MSMAVIKPPAHVGYAARETPIQMARGRT